MAARSGETARSLMIRIPAPSASASSASAHSRVEPALEPVRAVGHRPGGVDRVAGERPLGDRAQPSQLGVAQDRLGEHQAPALLGRLLEEVSLRAEARGERHDHLLAHGVDGRVRDLREQLLEVREQRRLLVRQDREGGVVAHRAGGLPAVGGHRREQHPQILLRPPERQLALAQRLVGLGLLGGRGEVVEPDRVLGEPRAVGALGGHLHLGLVVGEHPAAPGLHDQQAAGQQPPDPLHPLGRDVERARLRGQREPAVVGDHPAAGPQPVAVQRGAEDAAVGEGQRRGAVPRLHDHRAVVVEVVELAGQVGPPLRLGGHEHRRVGERASAHHEQLEHRVEGRRVRGALGDRGHHALDVGTERAARQARLAGAHPAHVAEQRVELAVVGAHVERVRERPRREGVGGEPRMDDGQRARETWIGQVGVEASELGRREHALVDDGARREARDRQVSLAGLRRARPPGGSRTACARRRRSRARRRRQPRRAGGSRARRRARARPRGRRPRARRASRSPAGPPRRRWPRSAPRARAGALRRGAGSRRPPRSAPSPAARPARRRA